MNRLNLKNLDRLHDPRAIVLKILYSVPGYQEADLQTKNAVYDMAIRSVMALTDKSA